MKCFAERPDARGDKFAPPGTSGRKWCCAKWTAVLGAMLLAALFAASTGGRHLDWWCYDLLLSLRGPQRPPAQVVVVAIDEPSLAAIGEQWPWQRERHARLIDTLYAQGARIVALDILFSEPGNPAGDRQLARSVQTHPGTILAAVVDIIDDPQYRHQSAVHPLGSLLSDRTRVGGINLPLDADGFVRRALLEYGGMDALSHAAARAFLSGAARQRLDALSATVNEVMINYAGPPRTLTTVSYYQALDPVRYLPADFFLDKLVFVGLSLHTVPEIDSPVADHFPFPYSRRDKKIVSGVEIHASVAANLLAGNYIQRLPGRFFWSCLVWGIGLLVLVLLRPGAGLVINGLVIAAIILGSGCLLSRWCLYFPLMPAVLPVAAGSLAAPFPHLWRLRREKKYIRDVFSRYVSPAVVKRLLQNPARLRLGGEMVDATVMFLDIADFTGMATRLPPETLVAVLSRYLGRFSDTILNWDGMVDKYVGDAIMAVWGAPISQADHPARACRAALEMLHALDELQLREDPGTGVKISIRIGINSGAMLAGNVGGRRFMDYTVHGEAANLAVRLEAVNKLYHTRILLGGETATRLGSEFVTREIACIRLLGQSSPVIVHELLGLDANVDARTKHRCRLFDQARNAYRQRQFHAAHDLFSQVVNMDDTDGPARIYQVRCRQYMETPPPVSWDGITEIRVK